ncbi:MAG: trypsin-like peptidase domain-containing protein [Bacteroidota bacterium]
MQQLPPVIGENVFAIGNPEGLEKTLSRGIVSNNKDKNYIQTDTPITHGSSGGPLFNYKGEVVGITTASLGKEGSLFFCINIQKIPYKTYLSY